MLDDRIHYEDQNVNERNHTCIHLNGGIRKLNNDSGESSLCDDVLTVGMLLWKEYNKLMLLLALGVCPYTSINNPASASSQVAFLDYDTLKATGNKCKYNGNATRSKWDQTQNAYYGDRREY